MVKPVNKFESVINASNVLKESRNKKSTVESKKTESKKLKESATITSKKLKKLYQMISKYISTHKFYSDETEDYCDVELKITGENEFSVSCDTMSTDNFSIQEDGTIYNYNVYGDEEYDSIQDAFDGFVYYIEDDFDISSISESKKRSKKAVKEAYSDPSEMSPEELCNYYNDGYFELYPKSEDLAMPWDADLSYDKSRNEYILEGGIAPGGGYKASVVARIPASEFWSLFEKA